MDLALYHPVHGYYARQPQRSGKSGDFFTSVDVGPLFGDLLERQLFEMAEQLGAAAPFDLVEAGAGNGRLAADILRAARARHPLFYDRIRLFLVEASAEARAAQRATLGNLQERLVWSDPELPATFTGALLANELLDALPVHQVVMRDDGLREVYVEAIRDGDALSLVMREGAPSTARLERYLADLGVTLPVGWRGEINLLAQSWIRDAAQRLARGFMICVDYGHAAHDLYSASHSLGTLTSFRRHQMSGADTAGAPAWLQAPGDQDLTAHVDFTSVAAAAAGEGLAILGLLDQTYFLLGVVSSLPPDDANELAKPDAAAQLKTLIFPGGLGSTHKVLLLGRDVGAPALSGCSFKVRMT
jgi:SAM-dependent MidA family methyltransferase